MMTGTAYLMLTLNFLKTNYFPLSNSTKKKINFTFKVKLRARKKKKQKQSKKKTSVLCARVLFFCEVNNNKNAKNTFALVYCDRACMQYVLSCQELDVKLVLL